MAYAKELNALCEVLATLYPTENLARVVVSEAGLPAAWIDFGGAAIEFWRSILAVAGNRGQMQALIDVARRHFPQNAALLAAADAWQTAPPPAALAAEEPPPTGARHIHIGGDNYGIVAGGDVTQATLAPHPSNRPARPPTTEK